MVQSAGRDLDGMQPHDGVGGAEAPLQGRVQLAPGRRHPGRVGAGEAAQEKQGLGRRRRLRVLRSKPGARGGAQQVG